MTFSAPTGSSALTGGLVDQRESPSFRPTGPFGSIPPVHKNFDTLRRISISVSISRIGFFAQTSSAFPCRQPGDLTAVDVVPVNSLVPGTPTHRGVVCGLRVGLPARARATTEVESQLETILAYRAAFQLKPDMPHLIGYQPGGQDGTKDSTTPVFHRTAGSFC